MSEPQITDDRLIIRRRLNASRERVFEAWTSAEAMGRWFCPDPDWEIPIAEADARPGGDYRIAMQNPDLDTPHIVRGTYREVEPPGRLVFTWRWESWRDSHVDSVVTIELHDHEGQTELVLTHELLPDANARKEHGEGWTGCLDRLEAYVS